MSQKKTILGPLSINLVFHLKMSKILIINALELVI
jgi:hypothetical protein